MRTINWIGCIFAAGLGACSLHPIPDDVSPFSTEVIVRYGRCEMRAEVIDHISRMFREDLTGDGIGKLLTDIRKKVKAKNKLAEEEDKLLKLAKVAVVYSFDFNITENNKVGGDAGFRLPGLTKVLDAGATAEFDLTRQGQRVFGTEDTWEDLIVRTKLCPNPALPQALPGNFIYPATGSIGVDRAVRTFLDIEAQEGGKDNFVDTLTFTTEVSAGANASLKIDPVPNHFRLVSATAAASASRIDIHKLTISLAFPQEDPPHPITGVKRVDGDLNAPFSRPAPWRARYNLCVADARARESSFKLLRLEAPEVYCIRYADAFAPSAQPAAAQTLRVQLQGGAPTSPSSSPPATGRVTRPQGLRELAPALRTRRPDSTL